MKLKPGFITRKIVNDTVLMDTQDTSRLLRLNETAADILALITEGLSEEEIVAKIVETYDINTETAKRDVAATLESLKSLGALEA